LKKRDQRPSKIILLNLICGLILMSSSRPHAAHPRTRATERIIRLIQKIERNMKVSKYQHKTRVRVMAGEYKFDCSGMASWILKRAAPRAFEAIDAPNDKRPLARHFYKTIAKIPRGKQRGPWMRLSSIENAGPGDIIAWIRPKWFPSKSTGHVAFILDAPRPNTGPVPGLLFRIADASKFRHEDDSRTPGETGFGVGTLLVPTDAEGDPIGYGWIGSETEEDWIVPTDLVIGRPFQ
jgi:hypothetical protein